MAKFENMTLSYTQIASIPFQTRKSASGSLLDALSRDLTPGQRVALFPSYVNQVYASGGVKDGESVTPPEGGGGSSDVPPTVEKAGPPRPGRGTTPGKKDLDIIPAGLIFGPDGKPQRVPDQQKLASLKDVGDGQDLPLKTRMAVVQKSIEEQLKKDGYNAKDIKKVAAAFTGQVMAESTFDPNALHDKDKSGNPTGYGIYGARLERRDAMLAWLASEGYEKNSLVGQARFMAHEAVTVPEYSKLMKDLSEMTDIGDMTLQVGKRFEKPQNIYDSIETRSNAAKEAAALDLSGLDEEGNFSRLENVYDKSEEEIAEATAEPVKASVSGADSIIPLGAETDAVLNPEKRVVQKQKTEARTRKGEITDELENTLALTSQRTSESTGRNLRFEVTSGGQRMEGAPGSVGTHQHDQGGAADFSIIEVMADGTERELKFSSPEDRKIINEAAYQFGKSGGKTAGSEYGDMGNKIHFGIPVEDDGLGPRAYEGSDAFKESWQKGHSEYLQWAKENKVDPKTGHTELFKIEQANRLAEYERIAAQTSEPVATASSTPLEYTDQGDPIDPKNGFLLPKDDPRYPKTAETTPKPIETTIATPEPKPHRISDIPGKGGYSAAAGGAEITDPSMIISEDGKKVTRVAETGPEKLSVMPRHKSSDVFQENQILMQEARQEQAREEAAKPDIATVKSSQQMSDFGRSKDTGQSIAISTVMPKITPSANKAFADAKMVGRFNKAGIDGDMGIVYIDRGYA